MAQRCVVSFFHVVPSLPSRLLPSLGWEGGIPAKGHEPARPLQGEEYERGGRLNSGKANVSNLRQMN